MGNLFVVTGRKKFTENFNEQIVFIDNKPQVKQSGLKNFEKINCGCKF